MRKFLNFFTALFIIISFTFVIWDNKDKLFNSTQQISEVKNDNLNLYNEKIYLNGINLDCTKPGQLPGELQGSKSQYEKWIQQIDDLGANCIKVKSIMPSNFYSALLEYNQNHKHKIYLIQGISVTSNSINTNEEDPTKNNKLNKIIKNKIRTTVDVIHGKKTPFFSKTIKQFYMSDISPYTIAYSIDSSLDYSDVIFSEIMDNNVPNNGYYVRATSNSSSTEKAFASIANLLVSYETGRYHTQRMLTIQANRSDIIQAKLLKQNHHKYDYKKRYIDVHNIYATKHFKSGIFDSYSLNLENNESINYDDISKQLKLLKRKDEKTPLVITEYANPTTRIGNNYSSKNDNNDGGINEQEQANNLIRINKEIQKAHCSGAFILEWQDAWYRNTWNVSDLVKKKTSYKWDNVLSYSEHYGLLDFNPSIIFPDGNTNDWKNIKPLYKSHGTQLSVSYDNAYLQIKLTSKQNLTKEPIILDFNITPDSGSNYWKDFKFEEPADFVIEINNKQGNILVQDYYDTNQFLENEEKIKQSPNYKKNPKSAQFNEIKLKTQNRYYSILKKQFIPEKYTNISHLIEGNANPKAKDYNSLTDYHISDHTLELRIPWQLLNFYDPSNHQIIGDMYKNRIITGKSINTISIGVTVGNGQIRLKDHSYQLPTWHTPIYHTRLKESYYRLQDYFKKEEGIN